MESFLSFAMWRKSEYSQDKNTLRTTSAENLNGVE